jgi:hypothetical protein
LLFSPRIDAASHCAAPRIARFDALRHRIGQRRSYDQLALPRMTPSRIARCASQTEILVLVVT